MTSSPESFGPRARVHVGALACAAVALLALVSTALADQRSDYLVRVLRTSPMFRVRAQAAISLGGVQAEPQVIEALSGALRDEHPAVRAAAAAALERHGDPSALPALQRIANDSEPAVRNAVSRAVARLQSIQRTRPRTVPTGPDTAPPPATADARFYVAVGRPGTTVSSLDRRTLDELQTFLESQLRAMSGVEVAPGSQSAAAANRVMRERRLVGYYLDSSIVEVTSRPEGGMRVRVSVVVQTYPGRDIRSMLSGSATVTAGSGPAVTRQAIEAALRGALRGLPNVMAAGADR